MINLNIYLKVFLPYPNVGFQVPTKWRDELVHRILNDIFREKAAGFFVSRRHDYFKVRCLYAVKHNYARVHDELGGMRVTGFCVGTRMRAKRGRETGNWLTCGRDISWFYGDGIWESLGLKSSRYGNSVLSPTRIKRKSKIGLYNLLISGFVAALHSLLKPFKFIYFCT